MVVSDETNRWRKLGIMYGHGSEEGVDKIFHILSIVSLVVGKISSGYKYCLVGLNSLYVVIFRIELSN